MTSAQDHLASRFPGLVWSNPEAPAEAYIRAALLRPRFLQILDLVTIFGLERIQREWEALAEEATPESRRAGRYTRLILGNIAKAANS